MGCWKENLLTIWFDSGGGGSLQEEGEKQSTVKVWVSCFASDSVQRASRQASRFPCISLIPNDCFSVWIDAIQGKEVEIIQEPALIERNFGVFEGKPFDDLVEAEVSSGKGFGMVRTSLFLSNNIQYPKYVNF